MVLVCPLAVERAPWGIVSCTQGDGGKPCEESLAEQHHNARETDEYLLDACYGWSGESSPGDLGKRTLGVTGEAAFHCG